MDKINVTRSSLPPMEEYIAQISSLWENHWLTNMGQKHELLKQQLKEYLAADNLELYANGHISLETIIEAMDLKGEVITTPFTFVSTVNAIIRKGLTPVFCDIKKTDNTMDPELIEKLITPRTSAIMPVHVYGNICDWKAIEKIAKKYDLKVIYDGAHAFGVKVGEGSIADFGDATMFSFHATKAFHTVEGGAVAYKNGSLTGKMEAIRNFGFSKDMEPGYPGGNGKMSELHAAMGLCNLKYIEENILGRKKVYERYREHLEGIEGVILWTPQENVESNYAYLPVVFDGYKYTRDEVAEMLEQNNIYPRKYFEKIICKGYEDQKDIYSKAPIAEYIADRVLCLPLYPELAREDIDRICYIVKGK